MKIIPKEKLIVRPSMSMFYGGGEIWFEQLDALSVHKDVVLTKLREDMETVRKPSSPGMIAVNLNETLVDREVADTVVDCLYDVGRAIRKVVFVGLNFAGKRLVLRALQSKNPVVCFTYGFINDFEKAKEWLIPR